MNGIILLLAAGLSIENNWNQPHTLSVDDRGVNHIVQHEDQLRHSEQSRSARHFVYFQSGSQFQNPTSNYRNDSFSSRPSHVAENSMQGQRNAQTSSNLQWHHTSQNDLIPQSSLRDQQNGQTQNNQQQSSFTTNQRTIPAFNAQPQTQPQNSFTNRQQQTSSIDSHQGIHGKSAGADYSKQFSQLRSQLPNTLEPNPESSQFAGMNRLTRPQSYVSQTRQPVANNQLYVNRQQNPQLQYPPQQQQPPRQQYLHPQLVAPAPNLYMPPNYQLPVQPQPQAASLNNQIDKEAMTDAIQEAMSPIAKILAVLEERTTQNLTPVSQQLMEIPTTQKSNSNLFLWLFLCVLGAVCFYLAWIAQDYYHRYRNVSEELREAFVERGTNI